MGHVNCKEQPAFKKLMQKYFHNVFMFSMNDVAKSFHTGFGKMSHYNIALCCGKRVEGLLNESITMRGDINPRACARAWERLALVPAKFKARGIGWLTRRVYQELRRASFIAASFVSRLLRRIVYSIVRGWLSKGILFAVYDLEHFPISYDIIWFLVWVDLKRRREDLKHLQCVFVPCRDKTTEQLREGYDAAVDRQSRAWRFNNICVEATTLVPGCGCTVSNTRALADDMAVIARMFATSANPEELATIFRQTIDGLAAEGANWNGLSASIQGRRYVAQWLEANIGNLLICKPVGDYAAPIWFPMPYTQFLRPWKNGPAFAHSLDPAIYGPVIIPDTDNAMAPVPALAEGFLRIFLQAAWNLSPDCA